MKETLLTILSIPLTILLLIIVLTVGHIVIAVSMIGLSLWFIQACLIAFYKAYIGGL
jgi:hypothetical protein